MAASGSFNITTSNKYIIGKVNWSESNVNSATNKSTVYAECRLSRTNNYTTASSVGDYTIYINGVSHYEAASMDRPIKLNSNTLVVSFSLEVEHNPDGSKTIEIGISADTSNLDISYQSTQAVLSTIPRKSTLSYSDGTIGSTMPITVNSADSSFTHTIKYSFGSLSGTVATGVKTNYNWTVPTTFYTKIPNAKYGDGTFTCETYSGSTLVGTSSSSFRVWCNEANCKPTLDVTLEDTNQDTVELTGSSANNVVLVDYKSNAKLTLSYSAKNSATIKQVLINGQAQAIGTVYNLSNVQFASISIQVVDSRRYSSDEKVYQSTNSGGANYFKRIPYVNLSISPMTSRSSQIADDMFIEISGNYFKGNFSDTIANTLSLSWKVRERNGEWTNGTTTLTPTISDTDNTYKIPKTELINPISSDGTWDYQKIYEFEITAADKLMTVIGSDSRPKGQPNYVMYPDVFLLPSGNPILDYEVVDEWEEEDE